jgi:hypothetical protein
MLIVLFLFFAIAQLGSTQVYSKASSMFPTLDSCLVVFTTKFLYMMYVEGRNDLWKKQNGTCPKIHNLDLDTSANKA